MVTRSETSKMLVADELSGDPIEEQGDRAMAEETTSNLQKEDSPGDADTATVTNDEDASSPLTAASDLDYTPDAATPSASREIATAQPNVPRGTTSGKQRISVNLTSKKRDEGEHEYIPGGPPSATTPSRKRKRPNVDSGSDEDYSENPTPKPKKKRVQSRVPDCVKDFRKQCTAQANAYADLHRESKEVQKQLAKANAEITKLQKYNENLRSDLHDVKLDRDRKTKTVRDLNRLSEKSGKELLGLRGKNDQLRRQLAKKLESSLNEPEHDKVPDDVITEKWKKMSFNIRQCGSSLTLGKGHTMAKTDSTASRRRRASVTAVLESHAEHPAVGGLHLQRYIWQFLRNRVFNCHWNVWGHGFGESLFHVIHDLQEDFLDDPFCLSFISKMKSTTAKDLGHTPKQRADVTKTLVKHLKESLEELVEPQTPLLPIISDILQEALELQRIFMVSRALFRVIDPYDKSSEGEIVLNPDTTFTLHRQIDSVQPKSGIHLSISPAVEKVGNADGERFATRQILCKGLVAVIRNASVSASIPDSASDTRSEGGSASIDVKAEPEADRLCKEETQASREDEMSLVETTEINPSSKKSIIVEI